VDFTGTDSQLPGPTNITISGTIGLVFTVVGTRLFYEEYWNRGMMNPIEIIAPKGSLVNADWPAAVSMSALVGMNIMNLIHVCVSKMLVCSEKYYNDQNASWMSNYIGFQWGGANQYGQTMATLLFDALAGGQGAGATFDGVDTGAFTYTPEVIAGDLETYESVMPFLYLARRQAPDSGGPGKFRGGMGLELIHAVHNTRGIEIVGLGFGKKSSAGPGLFGGHQPGAAEMIIAQNTDSLQWFEKGRGIYDISDVKRLKGEIKDYPPMFAGVMGKSGTIIYSYMDGGAGYADPLDRNPRSVFKDVLEELTSMEYAKDVYGVIITPWVPGVVTDRKTKKALLIDERATEEQREKIKHERRLRSEMKKENFTENNNTNPWNMVMRIHEYLGIDEEKRIRCIKCGHDFCGADDNYKLHALKAEIPGSEIGKHYVQESDFVVYHEFYCPGCTTLLASDVLPAGEPPLWDIQVKV
ncbi:MAG: hydantoinase B/oxoprolinase family protein, partial [Thermodesulfobacteriota bacterium]|nr:hydantoinase B/oxoprolinase family protein [Thermodesulfobacteriota bacterium]